jgi:hypothetical protein
MAEATRFRPARYVVGPVDFAPARAFVATHHYAASYPADRLRYGMFDRELPDPATSGRPALVGVAVLSVPVHPGVLTSVFPTLEPYTESLELGRFVLLDECPANAESWFLARAFRLAAEAGIRGIVSFADPVPRATADGRTIMPGHVGYAYQGSGALYLGRSGRRPLLVLPDGTVLNARSVSKVRNGERGAGGVERRLVRLGARPPAADEDPGTWLRTALDDVDARRIIHRGVHRYAFRVGDRSQRRRTEVARPAEPFPRVHDGVPT